jgi:hypothetical protein
MCFYTFKKLSLLKMSHIPYLTKNIITNTNFAFLSFICHIYIIIILKSKLVFIIHSLYLRITFYLTCSFYFINFINYINTWPIYML